MGPSLLSLKSPILSVLCVSRLLIVYLLICVSAEMWSIILWGIIWVYKWHNILCFFLQLLSLNNTPKSYFISVHKGCIVFHWEHIIAYITDPYFIEGNGFPPCLSTILLCHQQWKMFTFHYTFSRHAVTCNSQDPLHSLGFPCGLAGKESTCNVRDLGLIFGLGRSSGEGKGYPLQYSGLENSMDCRVHGVTKSQTRMSDFHSLCPHSVPSFSSWECSSEGKQRVTVAIIGVNLNSVLKRKSKLLTDLPV